MNSSNATIHSYIDGSCFVRYDAIACTRDCIEVAAAVITGVFCVLKLVKLHAVRHELWNQYLIFYSAIVELLLLTINWIYLKHSAILLIAELFKLFQFMVVCRFYCEVASRLAKTERLYKRVFLPALGAIGTYFVVLTFLGIAKRVDAQVECLELVWIQLSGSEVVLAIVSIIIGIYITRKTNKLKTETSFKRNIKLSLWGIILSFQASSVTASAYDIVMLFKGKDSQCKGIVLNSAAGFTTTHILLKVVKWLLPIWAMIVIYKPESFHTTNDSQEEDANVHPPIVRHSSVGVFKSEFRPRGKSFNYKHLRNPDDEMDNGVINGGVEGDAVENLPSVKVKKKKRRNRGSSGGGSTSVSPETPEQGVASKNVASKMLSVFGGVGKTKAEPVGEVPIAGANDPVA